MEKQYFNLEEKSEEKNAYYVALAFVFVILFQLTSLKIIWGLELVSRIANIVIIVFASGYSMLAFIKLKFNISVCFFYIIPGLFVFFGIFVNTLTNTISNLGVLNQFGSLLPWALYLTVPYLLKKGAINSEVLWNYYYYFMLIALSLSIIEYILVINGMVGVREIATSGGDYLAGRFTIFLGLEDGAIHYRFYGPFPEPGTLAMYLIPAITYAVIYRKYFGICIFLPALYLTDSLGGYPVCQPAPIHSLFGIT